MPCAHEWSDAEITGRMSVMGKPSLVYGTTIYMQEYKSQVCTKCGLSKAFHDYMKENEK